MILDMFILFMIFGIYIILVWWSCKRKRYFILILIILLPMGLVVYYKVNQYLRLKNIVPIEIGISFPVFMEEDFGFRGGCREFVFILDKETSDNIAKYGIQYLSGATHARGSSRYEYRPWIETPIPDEWESVDFPMYLCNKLGGHLAGSISKFKYKSGSFYTSVKKGRDARLLVVPELRYVVYTSAPD